MMLPFLLLPVICYFNLLPWRQSKKRSKNLTIRKLNAIRYVQHMFNVLTLGFRKGLALLLSIKKNRINMATERLDMNLSLVGDLVGTL